VELLELVTHHWVKGKRGRNLKSFYPETFHPHFLLSLSLPETAMINDQITTSIYLPIGIQSLLQCLTLIALGGRRASRYMRSLMLLSSLRVTIPARLLQTLPRAITSTDLAFPSSLLAFSLLHQLREGSARRKVERFAVMAGRIFRSY
jgi:hypothetical protein